MKKITIVVFYIIALLMAPYYANAISARIPERIINVNNNIPGGFLLLEHDNRDYLFDTSTGRLWKLIGTLKEPEYFKPINYEISKGKYVPQTENDPAKHIPGRFSYAEEKGVLYFFDTIAGNLWKLQGTPEEPTNLTLIPRKD